MTRSALASDRFVSHLLVGLFCFAAWFAAALPPALAQEPSGEPEAPAEEEENPILASIAWEKGPTQVKIGSHAVLDVPAGYRFCGPEGTQKLLQAMGNTIGGDELGFLSPMNLDWFVVFDFDDIGYVKDDEKDKIDAAAILESFQEGAKQDNERRVREGRGTLDILGWHIPPNYNSQTNNLEWCLKLESRRGAETHQNLNYDVRLLGRGGVMEASLVLDIEQLETVLPTFRDLLKGYSYVEGQRYSEYKSGDKLAAIGLTALIAGGGVALAAKVGLLAYLGKFWKMIALGIVAIGAAIKNFVVRLFGGGRQSAEAGKE